MSLQNSIFVSGCADGFGALGAVATGGSAPYQYTLLDINDNVISPSAPGASTYNGLNTSNVYKISVLDACGSVVNRLISSNSQIEIGTPGYTKMPCKGNSFALTLPQFSGVGYVWMKDGVVIPSITGNVLNFPNIQLSDSGTYQSIMTIGNCQVTGSLYINPDNCGGPLAVELTSFNANCDPNGGVVLKWITASEMNSLEFVLLKSPDLVNWTRVGVIPAKGNSNVVSDYTMLDR